MLRKECPLGFTFSVSESVVTYVEKRRIIKNPRTVTEKRQKFSAVCGRSRIEGSKHRCVNGEQGVQCENFRIDRANQERNNPENSEDVEENEEEEEDQADEENGISRGSLGKVVKCIFAVRRRRRPMSDGESL